MTQRKHLPHYREIQEAYANQLAQDLIDLDNWEEKKAYRIATHFTSHLDLRLDMIRHIPTEEHALWLIRKNKEHAL